MTRLRGNARKRKARLTNQTLSAVMEVGGRRSEAAQEQPEVEKDAALETVELDILALLRSEPDTTTVPAVYNDTTRVYTGSADFQTDRFIFGLMLCPQCHSEMVYYQRREVLESGYHFRCRICQHELVATLD